MENTSSLSKRASRIGQRRVVHEGKWLRTCAVDFTNEQNRSIIGWEMVERTNKGKLSPFDGVDVIAIIKRIGKPKQLLLIANYRPPVDGYVIEFPAGLMDDSDLLENGRRELLEETGYTAESIREFPFSPIVFVDPWKSNESSKIVLATINGDDPVNSNPVQNLEMEENIQVLLFDIDEKLLENVKKVAETSNYLIEAKIYSLLIGMQLIAAFE